MSATAKNITGKHTLVKATFEIQREIERTAELQQQATVLAREIEEQRAAIITYLTKRKADELSSPDGKRLLATWHLQLVDRFQTKLFQDVHPKLYEEFVQQQAMRRLLIK